MKDSPPLIPILLVLGLAFVALVAQDPPATPSSPVSSEDAFRTLQEALGAALTGGAQTQLESTKAALNRVQSALEGVRESMKAELIDSIPEPSLPSVDLGEVVVTDFSGLKAAIESKAGAVRVDGAITLPESLVALAPLTLRGNKQRDELKIGLLQSGIAFMFGGKVSDLTFSGDGGNVGDAISVGRKGLLTVEHCAFRDLGRGVALNGSISSEVLPAISILNCTFSECASPHDAAVYLNWHVAKLTIRDNLFTSCGGGIWVGNIPTGSGEVAGNTVRNYSRNGIESFFASGISFVGNTIEGYVAGTEGIGMSITGSNHRVIGNKIKGSAFIGLEHYGPNIISTGNLIEGLVGRPGLSTTCMGISVDASTDGLVADNEVIVPASVPKLQASGQPFNPPQVLPCYAIQVIGNGGPTKGTRVYNNRLTCQTGVVVSYGCDALSIIGNDVRGLPGVQMNYAVVLYSGKGHQVKRNTVSNRGAHPFLNGLFTATAKVEVYFDDSAVARSNPVDNFYFGTNGASTNVVLP